MNARAREGSLWVLDAMDFDGPKTSKLWALLDAMGLADKKVLILTDGINRNLYLSGRNLPAVDVMPYPEAAAYDVLWADAVLVEQRALGGGATVVASEEDQPEAASKPKAKAKAKKAPKKEAAAKPKAAKPKESKAAGKPKKPAAKKKGRE